MRPLASELAVMTVIFSVLVLVTATALRRFPRTGWLRTTEALTVLSFVSDLGSVCRTVCGRPVATLTRRWLLAKQPP